MGALAVKLALAGIVVPDQPESARAHRRVLDSTRASLARFVAPQAFSAKFRIPALGEHLQRVGLELAGILEDGLDSVRSGRHGWILLEPASLLSELPKPGCFG